MQQRHLEGLAGTMLQILRTLFHFGRTAVVQLVELTVGGWEVHEWDGGAPRQADKESERWGGEKQFTTFKLAICFAKIDCTEEKQEVSKCCGICLCPYLVVLIVALYTSVPVGAQTSLCKEHIEDDEARRRRGAPQVPKRNCFPSFIIEDERFRSALNGP